MTRQEEFKAELFDLLRRYKVEMEVVQETDGYSWRATGINFSSGAQYDGEGSQMGGMIDLTVGLWENGEK